MKVLTIKIDYMDALAHDEHIKVDDEVLVRWTNSHSYFVGKAKVSKVNAKSLLCKLEHPVGGPGMYPAGQEIRVPRAINVREWTPTNCAIEWKDEYATAPWLRYEMEATKS